jgi:tRNA pseudouridine55 synthase
MGSVCGLLNVNKPQGMTSRRAVDHVARFRRKMKVGHAGTLDPLASGVLVLCVGAATRLIPYVQRMRKCYRGTFLFGLESPTEDVEGEVRELDHAPEPGLEEIVEAAGGLTGEIMQRPPAFSALKVGGRRAYDLARGGKTVELKPRPVVVYRLEVTHYEYPELTLNIECGAGTYVRSLGRDLAKSLGTAAVMSALVRTAVGGFTIQDSVPPKDLAPENWRDHLLPPLKAVESLPKIGLSVGEIARVRSGGTIRRPSRYTEAKEWAAVDQSGGLVAILVSRGPGVLGPALNLPS